MAYWLVQTNGVNAVDYQRILQAFKDVNVPYKNVKLRPFTHNVQGLPNNWKQLPIVLLGTVNLSAWGKKKGIPGVWWNDNFNFEVQLKHYGNHMLNADSEIHPFGLIPQYEGERFIRPVDDGKAFTGEIVDYQKLFAWQERIRYLNSEQLTPSLPVQISSVKSIFREYRFFVVEGKIVTGSMYNEDNKLIRRALENQDKPVIKFAEEMINIWRPADVFVIDIAVLNEGGLKIIEINNANASGFYESDIGAFIMEVNKIL